MHRSSDTIATIAAANAGIDAQSALLTGFNETITGAGVRRAVARNVMVETGLDVATGSAFPMFKGRKVGLITNQSGLTKDGTRNVDAMLAAGVKLVSILAPEHGIF